MGGGAWTSTAYCNYTTSTRGMDSATYSVSRLNVQETFKARTLDKALSPYKVMRECLDTEEHPNTVPVILALDVTGSMGGAATQVSRRLGQIMEQVYEAHSIPDVEFCIMAIGDLSYDRAPVQISQFESDIRIAEQLDKVWFESGGGGNAFESYTAAWYMGLNHCNLDCWKRGKRGIIITLGDEKLNPYLRGEEVREFIGDTVQADVETSELYPAASEKFDIHHISVNDPGSSYARYNARGDGGAIDSSWKAVLGENYHVSTIDGLEKLIPDIIAGCCESPVASGNHEISW